MIKEINKKLNEPTTIFLYTQVLPPQVFFACKTPVLV